MRPLPGESLIRGIDPPCHGSVGLDAQGPKLRKGLPATPPARLGLDNRIRSVGSQPELHQRRIGVLPVVEPVGEGPGRLAAVEGPTIVSGRPGFA